MMCVLGKIKEHKPMLLNETERVKKMTYEGFKEMLQEQLQEKVGDGYHLLGIRKAGDQGIPDRKIMERGVPEGRVLHGVS